MSGHPSPERLLDERPAVTPMLPGLPLPEIQPPVDALGMRHLLEMMLAPMFAEDALHTVAVEVGGKRYTMRSDREGGQVATSSDRKIINLLAGLVGQTIRRGQIPSRHVRIDSRDIIDALACEGVTGGSEYARIKDRLQRLASTRIEVERTIGPGVVRQKQFSWIDGFEQDVQTGGSRRVLALKITLSEEAFESIMSGEGFDLSRHDFHATHSARSSVWRIYEICLGQLLRSGESTVRIGIDELRRSVPILSDLKVFKARTLKMAMEAIAANAAMAQHIQLSLEKQTGDQWEPLDGGPRVALHRVFLRVDAGEGPLPEAGSLNELLGPEGLALPSPADVVSRMGPVHPTPGHDRRSLRANGSAGHGAPSRRPPMEDTMT